MSKKKKLDNRYRASIYKIYEINEDDSNSRINYMLRKLEDKLFLTPLDLVKSGIFSSTWSVIRARNRGDFSFVKIGKKNYVVPKEEFVEFIKQNFFTYKKKRK